MTSQLFSHSLIHSNFILFHRLSSHSGSAHPNISEHGDQVMVLTVQGEVVQMVRLELVNVWVTQHDEVLAPGK